VREVKLEEVLLILSIEEAEARLAAPGWAGIRSRIVCELIRIAGEAAVRIVEDVEQPWINKTAVGLLLLQRRPKRATSQRQLIGSAQSEPNRRGDQNAEGAGRREGKTLLANSIAGRNGRASARRRDARQSDIRYQRHDGESGGIDRHGEISGCSRGQLNRTAPEWQPARPILCGAREPAPGPRRRRSARMAGVSRLLPAWHGALPLAGRRCSAPTVRRIRRRGGSPCWCR
jgi:hypothetical protein